VPAIWVVKLGGSLYAWDRLPRWLDALAQAGVALVPGGGPFADQARAAQARWGLGDPTAHAIAILAMRQYGLMLAGLCPDLATAASPAGLAAFLAKGRSAVWLPDPEAPDLREVPASWAVTSDSLAAWLARRIGADHLLLVKSAPLPAGELPAGRLAAEGWVDAAFPDFIAGARFKAWLCHKEDHDRLSAGMRDPAAAFARIVPDAGRRPALSEVNP
jgi:aspartokinase-like uncharacterized kinase